MKQAEKSSESDAVPPPNQKTVTSAIAGESGGSGLQHIGRAERKRFNALYGSQMVHRDAMIARKNVTAIRRQTELRRQSRPW